ncbi:MAG: hypothetical protein Ct9H90mP2_10170 [Dehalococcoidia bacterium]|nr:MAG: hypothetical protein Ct9H90mP2_10170 [Dehalococcoidia bacterium]
MKNKPHEIERATYLLWVAHNLERIADRGLNIAERLCNLLETKHKMVKNGLHHFSPLYDWEVV